jgi:hypothetical protein
MTAPGLAGTNDQQATHVDAVGVKSLQSGDGQVFSVATDIAAHNYWCVRLA